jgi:hypothetical protein
VKKVIVSLFVAGLLAAAIGAGGASAAQTGPTLPCTLIFGCPHHN